MSDRNLRHLIKAREYKERGQLSERRHLGLLEKKKDYKLRAVNYHKNEDQLKALKRKAMDKNPDEFYMAMHKTQTEDGLHVIKRGKTRTAEELKKIKEQDLAYLKLKGQMEMKHTQKLQDSLHMLDEQVLKKAKRKHVIFTDTEEEAKNFDAAAHFNTVPELMDRTFNRLTKEQLASGKVIINKLAPGQMAAAEKQAAKSYEELDKRRERHDDIAKIQSTLQLHKNLTTKGKRTKIITKDIFGEEIKDKTVYRWKTERKR